MMSWAGQHDRSGGSAPRSPDIRRPGLGFSALGVQPRALGANFKLHITKKSGEQAVMGLVVPSESTTPKAQYCLTSAFRPVGSHGSKSESSRKHFSEIKSVASFVGIICSDRSADYACLQIEMSNSALMKS